MWRRVGILIALVNLVFSPIPSHAVAPTDSKMISDKILACYRPVAGKIPTIQQMHDCSGVWVTPNALLMCAMQTQICPIFSDTPIDRGTFFGEMQAQHLELTSPLVIPSQKEALKVALPPMPTRERIETCRRSETGKDARAFRDCVLQTMLPSKFSGLLPCFQQQNDKDRASCFARQVNNDEFKHLMTCIGDNRPTPDKILECTNAKLEPQLKERRECIVKAATPDAARQCLSKDLDPKQAKVAECLIKARNGNEAASCLDAVSDEYRKSRVAVDCLRNSKRPLISCSNQIVAGNAKDTVNCLMRAQDPKAQIGCATAVNPELPRAQKLAQCLSSNVKGAALLECTAPYLGADAQRFSTCASAQNANIGNCLAAVNPRLKAANDTAACLTNVRGADKSFGCIADQIGGDAPRVAGCLAKSDRNEVALCLLGNKPEVRAAQMVYDCVSKVSDAASVIGHCSQVIPIDDKTRETLSCAARAGGDKSKLAECAAVSILPPQAGPIVACAANSQGLMSFALCQASPAMNAEWRMVAECAAQTGGNPVGVAGCSAGRLTIRELTKCFTGKFGQDCFGSNNTIIKDLTNAFNDITHGLGPNNEIVRALDNLRDLSGGPNSVINNPGQIWGGPNSMINNPGQIFGGENSAINQFFQKPLGGDNSAINQFLQKPLGGPNSAVNQFLEKPLGGNNSFFHCPFGC